MTQGELLTNYGSYVPWGLWVAGKIYFVGLAVGASFLAWVIYAFNIQRLRPIVSYALLLSVITLASGLLIISFDLGHMWRMYEVFTRPNFSSLLATVTWLSMAYLVYTGLVLLAELRAGQKNSRGFRLAGWIGILFAITFSGANGSEFATLISRPYWNSALGPILSIGGALLTGIALVLAAVALFPLSHQERNEQTLTILSRIVVGLILFVLLLEWSEYSVTMWYGLGESYSVLSTILFGQYWYVFWIVHLALGSILPLIFLLWKPAHNSSRSRGSPGCGGLHSSPSESCYRRPDNPGHESPAKCLCG
jgi:molybdopterin-containing oxidoreductase family membrane subunit